MTISMQFRQPSSVGPSSAPQHRTLVSRQASVDVNGENGCCLVKALISNLLTFATRSRRKGADLGGGKDGQRTGPCNNGNGVCPAPEASSACTSAKKTGVISFSQTGSTKSPRKAVQSVDTCVSDTFDEQMIDKLCTLPRDMDRNEWLATHVLSLFEHVNGISGILSESCTPASCSMMSYPGNLKAAWVDERGKRHNYSAMRYIDSVMAFCEASSKNQALFPTKYGATFSTEFEAHCSRMVRLLWHCLGHMYSKHWEHLGTLNLRPQFGLVLAHLARLAKMYNLLAEKELLSMANTLQLARPQEQHQSQQRPVKRVLDETGGHGTNKLSTTAQGRIQQQKKKAQQKANEISMKSGSWGGHSAVVVQSGCSGLLTNCQKCYAQTC